MGRRHQTRRVSPKRKILGFLVGGIGSILALESSLWVAHFLTDVPKREPDSSAINDNQRNIICVGDSHTYGVYITPEESYPGRLQQYLDRVPDNSWRVINLGYPGRNTAEMRARLSDYLAVYDPEIVVFWGGINNSWSPAMSYLWENPEHEPERTTTTLLEHSRAYRALRMIVLEGRLMLGEGVHNDDAWPDGRNPSKRMELYDTLETTAASTASERDWGSVQGSIVVDLRRVHSICESHGARLVLGEYWSKPLWVDERINEAIRKVAGERQIPVPPLRDRIRDLVDEFGHDRVLTGDDHASGVGNREVARLILMTLVENGFLEPRPAWKDIAPLEDLLSEPTLMQERRNGDNMFVELIAPPRWPYRIRAYRAYGLDHATPGDAIDLAVGKLGRFGSVRTGVVLPLEPGNVESWEIYAETRAPDADVTRSLKTNVIKIRRGNATGSD